MRLDKYLKVSRVIKRRSVAKQIADQGRITINDKIAKSASDVVTGDTLVINFGNKTLTLKVLELKDTTKKMRLKACTRSSVKNIRKILGSKLNLYHQVCYNLRKYVTVLDDLVRSN